MLNNMVTSAIQIIRLGKSKKQSMSGKTPLMLLIWIIFYY